MVTRWWAVALLSLSVGLNLGLVVAVVQQRFAPPAPAPTVVVIPSPGTVSAPADESPVPPVATSEVAPPVAPPLRGPSRPADASDRDREPAPSPQGGEQPPPGNEIADAFAGGAPPPGAEGDPGPRGPDRPGADGGGGPGPRGDGPPQARLEEMAARLGVPPADRPRFIELQRTFIAETRQRHVQLEATRRALRAELLAPKPDPQRLRAYVDDSARLHAALERAFVEHVLAARELLDGDAERRYLQFLSRLGPRAGGPAGPPGRTRPGDPRWQRERPWRPGPGRGGLRNPGGRGFLDEPAPAPSPVD